MKRLGRRAATEADRDFVFRVKAATLRYAIEAAWGWEERVQRRLHDDRFDRGGLEILIDGEEPAGYVNIRRETGGIRLLSLFLLPPWQSQGIGTSLLEELMREAVAARLPVRLRVLKANVRARVLYERLGLVVTQTTETNHEMRWQPPGCAAGLSS